MLKSMCLPKRHVYVENIFFINHITYFYGNHIPFRLLQKFSVAWWWSRLKVTIVVHNNKNMVDIDESVRPNNISLTFHTPTWCLFYAVALQYLLSIDQLCISIVYVRFIQLVSRTLGCLHSIAKKLAVHFVSWTCGTYFYIYKKHEFY